MEKVKRKTRNFFVYSEDNLQKAIEAVKNGMSKKKASVEFGVPRSTLIRKLSGNVPIKRRMGPSTELNEAEENVFVEWILAMGKKGFPVHKDNLIQSVRQFLVDHARNVRFLNKETMTPGRAWFEGFLKRHPNIKERHAEGVSKARAAVTRDRIEKWFDEIHDYLKQNNLEHILSEPNRIFNADEAGFALCPKTGKVLGPTKCQEDFYERVSNPKQQITVMGTFSADGKVAPPMLIFPYKKMPKAIVESVPETWALGSSESGWINSEVFYEYIANHFLPYLKCNNIVRPVILYVDGHRSHLTRQVSQFCDDHGIILIALFPNTTHITQPADVSVFKPLKSGWKSAVRRWKFQNFPKDVTRYTFGHIIKGVFDEFATSSTITNGFRRCGIYPFDKNNVDYTKCIPNRPTAMPKTLEVPQSFKAKILEAVEQKIDKHLVERFSAAHASNSDWQGSRESFDLYKVWCLLKDDCSMVAPVRLPITAEDEILDTSLSTSTTDTRSPRKSPALPVTDAAGTSNMSESNKFHRSPSQTHHTAYKEFNTPEHVNLYTYENKENEGFKVPTPFKKCLPFPKTPEKKITPTRKRTIYPAVVSSKAYRNLYDSERQKKIVPKIKKQKVTTPEDDSSSESEIDVPYIDEDNDISDLEAELNLKEGQYVIVMYEGSHYPGIIVKKEEDGAEIRTMVSAGIGSWKWPLKEDLLYYFNEDIKCTINSPVPKNKRGHYDVAEMLKFQ